MGLAPRKGVCAAVMLFFLFGSCGVSIVEIVARGTRHFFLLRGVVVGGVGDLPCPAIYPCVGRGVPNGMGATGLIRGGGFSPWLSGEVSVSASSLFRQWKAAVFLAGVFILCFSGSWENSKRSKRERRGERGGVFGEE